MNDYPTTPAAGPRVPSGPSTPLPPSGSERGDETRAALVAAGRRLFARKGFDGASVRDITREAGANLGAVTYHFGSKRALYTAVLVQGLTPMVERVGAAAAGAGTPMERLERVVEAFFEHVGNHPDLPRLMLQEVTAGRKPPPELVAIVRRNLAYVVAILSDGWADGSLRQGHPILTALSVVSQPIYMTLVTPMLREAGGMDLADPATRAVAVEHVKAFIRAGLAVPQEEEA